MIIKTSDTNKVRNLFNKFKLPQQDSHKGKNGKVLIIGGSSLFHAASLWAAEVCSHFTDMVHYSSTVENERIFHDLKKTFRNGIIVRQSDLDNYVREDDVILIGPGMMRDGDEGRYTFETVKRLIVDYPDKKFVFDAGALQMMDKEWLIKLKIPGIITPHQKEFEDLFGINIREKKAEEKRKIVKETAARFRCTIILKAVSDIVSDGTDLFVIEGGNAGLTKGGTGDVLAGLVTSFYVKNSPVYSGVFSSVLLKLTADELYKKDGYWYNIGDIISKLPEQLRKITL